MDSQHAGDLVIGHYDLDEEALAATRADGVPRARVYPFPGVPHRPGSNAGQGASPVAVVLGRGGRPEVELHLDAIAADRVPVLRRRGGGCAVVLDPGNLIVSVALPLPGLGGIRSAFARISAWLIEALARAGVPDVQQEGISDLARGDRKIGGACIFRTQGLLYYSTTLLVAPDLEAIERYLAHPPREPAYRRGRSHREFLGRLPAMHAGTSAAREVPAWAERLAAALPDLPA